MTYFAFFNPGEPDGNCEKTGFGQQGNHCCGSCRCKRKRQAAGSGQEGCCGTCKKGACQCQQAGGEGCCCSCTGKEICRTGHQDRRSHQNPCSRQGGSTGQETRCARSCSGTSTGCQKGRSGSGQKGSFCTRGKVGRRDIALLHERAEHGLQLGSALIGIEEKMTPPPPITGNAYALDLPLIPDTWEEAINVFEKSEKMARVFPKELITNLVMTKRQELHYMAELSDDETVELYLDTV